MQKAHYILYVPVVINVKVNLDPCPEYLNAHSHRVGEAQAIQTRSNFTDLCLLWFKINMSTFKCLTFNSDMYYCVVSNKLTKKSTSI